MSVDWNSVLLYGVPAYIAALGGAVAAVLGSLNRRNLQTRNGHTLAQVVEQTHTIAQDNATAIDGLTPQEGASSP